MARIRVLLLMTTVLAGLLLSAPVGQRPTATHAVAGILGAALDRRAHPRTIVTVARR